MSDTAGRSGRDAALAREFAELGDFLYAGGAGDAALQRLVDLAVSSVPDCTSASVSTWSAGKRFLILASSDETSRMVNQFQHDLGDGPCLTAASQSQIVHLPDLTQDRRFPQFSSMVTSQTQVRGMLSFHVAAQPVASALSLFSEQQGAFEGDGFAMAAMFAVHARALFAHAATAERAANLEKALVTSRQIGAAIGILMSTRKVTEDQAFNLLRDSSRDMNRKLRDIADEVTHTGVLPRRT